jgi:diguanylate cyclase (GGDEF)-like protein
MYKKNEFEDIRLYTIVSFVIMSLIYISISTFLTPIQEMRSKLFEDFFIVFIVCTIFNIIRYKFFSTSKYTSNILFIAYGWLDILCLNFYFGVPALDQVGKIVIMFIMIISAIDRGRKIGLFLTFSWFPIKIASNYIFDSLLQFRHEGPGKHIPLRINQIDNIVDALYFQIILFLLVFIIDIIYREICDKKKENEQLLLDLEQHYEELNAAHDEIENQNKKLKDFNADLEKANEKLVNSNGEFFTLNQISKAIGTILDMDELIKFVNDIILGVMGVKASTIILLNEKTSMLQIHTTNVSDDNGYKILSENINCDILIQVLEKTMSICDNEINEDKYTFTKGRNVKSIICIPLAAKVKKFGLILIEQDIPGFFDEEKLRYLNIIGQQVGIAMENAYLYEKMHQLAVLDNLTGAYNRMYFNEKLEEYFNKAKLLDKELSVIMFDIDYFKKINDTYGHFFGDKVLIDICNLVKLSLGENDFFARIGGEEFVILLPDASLKETYALAENIRKNIEETIIIEGDISVSVTSSFGIANYPENADNKMELMKNSDSALYNAKNYGRNCVKVSQY